MATRILVIPGGPGFEAHYLHPLRALLDLYELAFCESFGPRMDDHVGQLETARRRSGATVVLGHSFGGLVACHHALAFPGSAAGLILLDPDPATFAEWDAFRGTVASRRKLSEQEAMDTISRTAGWTTDPLLVSAYFRLLLAPYFADSENAAELDFGFSTESMARIQSQTKAVRADLGAWDLSRERIAMPSLLIHGAESVFSSSSPQTLAQLFPAGESHVLTSVGHFPHLEAPDDVKALAERFLAAHGFTP